MNVCHYCSLAINDIVRAALNTFRSNYASTFQFWFNARQIHSSAKTNIKIFLQYLWDKLWNTL